MLKKIKRSSTRRVNGAKPQCYMLFILSHGNEIDPHGDPIPESIIGTDGKYLSKRQIRDELSDVNCPNLKGVPKILFFCCCRGTAAGVDEADVLRQTNGHLLVCYPTREGFESIRNKSNGTRYVRSLVKVFMSDACNSDIVTMLTKVNATISELKTDSKRHQNPGFESYLDRQLYFFPGIIH